MRNTTLVVLGLLLAGALSAGCTDTNIYETTLEPNLPDKVAISGTICTDDPAERQFPVRLMFIVDTSGWVGPNDPVQRQFAVQDIVNRYVASPNYSFAVIKFAGGTRELTDGYSKNLAVINEAMTEIAWYDPTVDACMNGQCRDWLGALSLASSIFTGDVLITNPGTRSRTRYVFIFVAHGPPDPALGTIDQEKTKLQSAIDQIKDYGTKEGVAEVAFHTIQVDDPTGTCQGTPPPPRNCNSTTPCPANCTGSEICQDPQRLCAEDHTKTCAVPGIDGGPGAQDCATQCVVLKVCNNDVTKTCLTNTQCCPPFTCQQDPVHGPDNDRTAVLLQSMAFHGGGAYLRFFLESQLNFNTLKFDTTESVFVKKAFMVTNINAKPLNGKQVPDSDGDGLSDQEEYCYGEMLAGTCTVLADCDCKPDVWSKDNPAGTDTDPTKADTDGDGLNDKLEMLFATINLDPLRTDLPQACDGLDFPYGDRDSDGLNDCEEKLLGTDLSLFDTDRDGYPDSLEFRAGTNYLQADNLMDTDMDGVNNGDELEQHTDPQNGNDTMSRAGLAYRYKVIDEGMRVVPYASQPHLATGVQIVDESGRSEAGAGTLYYYPAGTTRSDGSVRANPAMAWRDPRDPQPGLEVEITGSGNYLLYSSCACVKDCGAACAPGTWCNPTTGTCDPDPCTTVTCSSTEKCQSSDGTCLEDCSLLDCGAGQRCDTLLGKCMTDRCLNTKCPGGKSCDTESGVCADPPCQGWQCPAGLKLNDKLKPPWITVKVDLSLLPQSGYWCDGAQGNPPCASDSDCTSSATPCRIRESIVVGLAHKNCITFKVKNVTLVETLETQPGTGAGLNNIFLYFAQTPLDNPRAFSVFREALVQMRFFQGKKDPDVAEIPLGDSDFFPVQEK